MLQATAHKPQVALAELVDARSTIGRSDAATPSHRAGVVAYCSTAGAESGRCQGCKASAVDGCRPSRIAASPAVVRTVSGAHQNAAKVGAGERGDLRRFPRRVRGAVERSNASPTWPSRPGCFFTWASRVSAADRNKEGLPARAELLVRCSHAGHQPQLARAAWAASCSSARTLLRKLSEYVTQRCVWQRAHVRFPADGQAAPSSIGAARETPRWSRTMGSEYH